MPVSWVTSTITHFPAVIEQAVSHACSKSPMETFDNLPANWKRQALASSCIENRRSAPRRGARKRRVRGAGGAESRGGFQGGVFSLGFRRFWGRGQPPLFLATAFRPACCFRPSP